MSNYIPVAFGYKTFAFLSECATCGKRYSQIYPDNNWRTAYTYYEQTKTGMWLLYCEDCFNELDKVVGE